MKQRISALDLQLLADELKSHLEGYRLTNIYNTADSSRQFLLRFNKPDSKFNVVVDCGLRIHITDFDRPIPAAPSGFVVKLRKHLKAKRLTGLRRVENDRILVLQFADGMFYLVLEFFSAGNVILLDESKKILSLQRIVHEHENKVGQKYTMFDDSIFQTQEQEALKQDEEVYEIETVKSWLVEEEKNETAKSSLLTDSLRAKKKSSKVASIHKLLLAKESHLSSDLISNNLKISGISPSTSCLEFIGKEEDICTLLNMTERDYRNLLSNKDKSGYILAKRNSHFVPGETSEDLEFVYETFHPFKPLIEDKDLGRARIIEVDGEYNKTLDKFFSTIESSKYALRIQQQEHLAHKKLEDARLENQKKIQDLLDVQSTNEQKGNTIIANTDLVEEAKSAVQGLVDQQMDWNIIEKLILSEQSKSNKIARLIKLPLKLKENKIDLLLPLEDDIGAESDKDDLETDSDSDGASFTGEESDSSDSDLSDFETEESTGKTLSRKKVAHESRTIKVTIDLGLSSYANASGYFNVKKSSAEKQKRVEQNVKKAMKNIEERIDKQLKKKLKESHNVLRKVRSPYFFEKFHWFFSSEGFLVLMGRSPQDTDQIFSKYIEGDDVYMVNSFGSNQVWIKNPDQTEIPPNTLMQAAVFCMSSSAAWSKKISSSPSWCFAKNISKFSDYQNMVLPPGVFHLKKESAMNMMPSVQLVMGFGFLWKVKTKGGKNDELANELAEGNVSEGEASDSEVEANNDVAEVIEDGTKIISMPQSDENPKEIESQLKHDLNSDTETVTDQVDDNATLTSQMNNTCAEVSALHADHNSKDDLLDIKSNGKSNAISSQMKTNVRGKKGKLKKIQNKYADQDDEERQLRLEALGTLKGVEKQEIKKQEELERQRNRELRKVKREKQKELQALKFTKNEKVKVNYARFTTELKPRVSKDDEIIDVVPVFAPWAALLKYKYKAKILPGNAKKTKTLTDVLHYFANREMDPEMDDKELDWPKEHEVIKILKAQDLVLTICSDKLKVTLPGQSNKPTQKPKGKQRRKKN